jgi:exopolyphosphatase/guanosine-5'-triphosphate,3'-diphosphate pyrophosphatase
MSDQAKVRQAMKRLLDSEWEITHAQKVRDNALAIFDRTRDLHGLGGDARILLESAALMHDIGFTVSEDKHHKHSYALIKASTLSAFSPQETELVANIARYHTKAFPSEKHEPFAQLDEEQKDLVRRLSAILRLADGLNRSHTTNVRALRCEHRGGKLAVHIRFTGDIGVDLSGGERKKDLFEEVFGVKVSLVPEPV